MVPGIATVTILPWNRGTVASVVHTWPVTAVCEYTGSVNIPANYTLAANRPVSKFLLYIDSIHTLQ